MNKRVLHSLEYNKIIERLLDFAHSAMAKEMCRALVPSSDINIINFTQNQVADALSRVYKNGNVSFSGIHDIGFSLKRLAIGSSLSTTELLHIGSLLDVALRVKAYSRKADEELAEDTLDKMFNTLEPLSILNNEIKKCIVSENEISDEASQELKSIRRRISQTNVKIHSQLNSMVNSPSVRTYLQDYVVTMRNGRYCLPVKQEYRNQIQGMIHDQSSSGSTVFIEPISVVRLNNDLKELYSKEEDEIEVILGKLSASTVEYIEVLESNLSILVELDFIFAKASYAKLNKCTKPIFNENGFINIKDARHPLLDEKSVIPINIHLGDEFTMLVITGPNTGGKTVALKTVGLLTLMGQAGLHIPAFDGSKLAVFDEVYADIGDEQSIEQSLSTFSSHMVNTVEILEKADSNSLVLFDELGAGTDPTEGAALAIAILNFLHNMKVRTMVTTHYSELKVYALTTPGVENASCEFDVETLRPTYRILIGVPGKSNAFVISKKLGLPDFIIEDAKNNVDINDIAFEDLLTDLENSRIIIENEQDEIIKNKLEIKNLKEELEKKSERLDARRERIIREANEEAHRILTETKDYADSTIKNFKKLSNDANSRALENERNSLRSKLGDTKNKLAIKGKKQSKEYSPSDFKIGDSVKVLTLNLEGTVSTLPNAKGDLYVQMGILRSQVNIKDLEILDRPNTKEAKVQHSNKGKIAMSKSSSISPEIKLIGMTVDEAISALDKYLDDAYLAHLPQARIVHGKGTGALRKAVHAHLKTLKYVKSYRLGVFGEGETGVTIVEFE